jgi:hypothetical protein
MEIIIKVEKEGSDVESNISGYNNAKQVIIN